VPRPRPDTPSLKRRRGRPVWQIFWRDADGPHWLSTGTADEPRARQALADFLAARDRTAQGLTIGAMLAAYLDSRRGKIVSFPLVESIAAALTRHLGSLRPDQLGQRAWDDYARARAIAPGTLKRERNVLLAAYNLAIRSGAVIRAPHLELPGMPAPRDRFLSRAEGEALIAAAKAPHVRLFVMLGLFTGARKGAIIALTWDRVDLVHGRIDFNEPGRAVTGKRRAVVPIGPRLRQALEDARELAQSDHVIEHAGRAIKRVRWGFRFAARRAGLGKDVTEHVLRHTAASWMAMGGIPLDQAADLLALDRGTLRRVYRKFDPGYLADAVAALEGTAGEGTGDRSVTPVTLRRPTGGTPRGKPGLASGERTKKVRRSPGEA